MKSSRIILWLRNDLRMHDNYVFNKAMQVQGDKEILPVFCFDPRIYGKEAKTEYDSTKTGLIRSRFQIQAVKELRKSLQKIGSNLILTKEMPEEFIPKLVEADASINNIIVYQQEICSEELTVDANLKKALEKAAKADGNLKFAIETVWGSTLHHIDDFTYNPYQKLAENYTGFMRNQNGVKVRALLPTPKAGQLPFAQEGSSSSAEISNGIQYLPELQEFGFSEAEVSQKPDKRECYPFIGGESKGLKRLYEYCFKNDSLSHYKDTRNGLIGSEFSSKLSPWLANGSLSIRKVYHDTQEYIAKNGHSQHSTHFISELFWRDFNKFWFVRYGNKGFSAYGIYDRTFHHWKTDAKLIQRWKEGQTGMPIIDAAMREMNVTGFMSNRARQFVASYLAMDLKQDWRYGAHHFEEKLVDHDVHSNYGGWNACSGIGAGMVRSFNTLKQSRDFDSNGEYIKSWCPELAELPLKYIHTPWTIPAEERTQYSNLHTYPAPIQVQKYTNEGGFSKQRQGNDLGFAKQQNNGNGGNRGNGKNNRGKKNGPNQNNGNFQPSENDQPKQKYQQKKQRPRQNNNQTQDREQQDYWQ